MTLPEPVRSGLHRRKRKYRVQQIGTWDHIMECLHRHNGGVNEARPSRESDWAAIR